MTKGHTDLELAKSIMNGDEKSFNKFFTDYYPRLFRFVLSRTNQDHSLADDFTQQSICKAIDKMASFRGDAALFTWICQIARSIIHAHFVKEKRRNNILQPMADNEDMRDILENIAMSDQQQPENIIEQHNISDLITEIMDSLPNNYGDLLEMKYVENLSIAEISEKVNTSMISVQSSLARARKAFKTVIDKAMKNNKLGSLIAAQLEF